MHQQVHDRVGWARVQCSRRTHGIGCSRWRERRARTRTAPSPAFSCRVVSYGVARAMCVDRRPSCHCERAEPAAVAPIHPALSSHPAATLYPELKIWKLFCPNSFLFPPLVNFFRAISPLFRLPGDDFFAAFAERIEFKSCLIFYRKGERCRVHSSNRCANSDIGFDRKTVDEERTRIQHRNLASSLVSKLLTDKQSHQLLLFVERVRYTTI